MLHFLQKEVVIVWMIRTARYVQLKMLCMLSIVEQDPSEFNSSYSATIIIMNGANVLHSHPLKRTQQKGKNGV